MGALGFRFEIFEMQCQGCFKEIMRDLLYSFQQPKILNLTLERLVLALVLPRHE